MQEKIDKIRFAHPSFGDVFANEVLRTAQSKADDAGENVYICLDYNSIYYVYHSFLIMTDDVITFAEPQPA